jgi:beta-lactamase class A
LRNRSPFSALRFLSFSLLIIALILTILQLVRFSRVRAYLPAGLEIASIPVGGLDRAEAAQRLREIYSSPVILRYNGAPIQMSPSIVDFQLNLESMLAVADLERTESLFWVEFWDYLWNRSTTPVDVPLRVDYDEDRLRSFLADIAERYDQPATAALPAPGTAGFQAGTPGTELDVEGSVLLIENALVSIDHREVDLPIRSTRPSRPAFQNLEVLLKQTIAMSGFEGLAGIYLLDLQTTQELHFAYQQGQDVSVQPDIAFTASSIIKIPIMVSTFRRLGDPPDPEALRLLGEVIDKSGNESADWLMDRVIDKDKGPLLVSDDMKTLGLDNTYLAGYFTAGSTLLKVMETPANQRTDINTDPDPYSQTTSSDMGMLLTDLYECAQNGGGALEAAFPGEITQEECQMMITYLVNNKLPALLTAGIPEGTQIAHKHGWVSTNGIINTIGDAGIIYSPGGNYVLVVFLHHPEQLVWEPASKLVADLSTAVYNYYNLPTD